MGLLSTIIDCLLIVVFSLIFFNLGIYYNEFATEEKEYLGCWKVLSGGNTSILIQTDGQGVVELMDTARHEICPEIYYRENKDNYDSNESEEFAEDCNPEDYYAISLEESSEIDSCFPHRNKL